eukprot:5983011-Amphidinium_carterae.1
MQRQQEAAAPAVRPEPPPSHTAGSERLTWDQYQNILAWLVPTQRHLPKALQATVRTVLRDLLAEQDPFASDPLRSHPSNCDLMLLVPKLLWPMPADIKTRSLAAVTRQACLLLQSRDWQALYEHSAALQQAPR